MVEFPGLPVVGLIGASFVNGAAPEGLPFNGAGLPYLDLTQALTIVQGHRFYQVETTANGGNTAFDGLPGPQSRGYVSQFEAMINRTTWPFTGENFLKVIVIDGTNSCLHNKGTFTGNPCTHEEMELVFDEIEKVVIAANALGIKAVVTGGPKYDYFDPELVKSVYFLEWFIDRDAYEYFISRMKSRVEMMDADWLPIWETSNIEAFDGIHYTRKSAFHVAHELDNYLMGVVK